MQHTSLLRVRVLGRLAVTRPDGSEIAEREWRTGKTRDLLRLLALADSRQVRSAALIERLWPESPQARAAQSLRMAVSQIRKTVGYDCIVRGPDGLGLADAWVDAVEFFELAARSREASVRGAPEEALELALRAEALYVGDFQAHDDDSAWADAHRRLLREQRQRMLVDAANAALQSGRTGRALDLANTAARLEPDSEEAHRVLMSAHEQRGDIALALRVFEDYRARLADELGVDPSPQTRQLHLRLLRQSG